MYSNNNKSHVLNSIHVSTFINSKHLIKLLFSSFALCLLVRVCSNGEDMSEYARAIHCCHLEDKKRGTCSSHTSSCSGLTFKAESKGTTGINILLYVRKNRFGGFTTVVAIYNCRHGEEQESKLTQEQEIRCS